MTINSCSMFKNATSGELLVQIKGNFIHRDFLEKILRCHGNKRKEQTNILIQDGVTNTISSNIIENRKTNTKGNDLEFLKFNISFFMGH